MDNKPHEVFYKFKRHNDFCTAEEIKMSFGYWLVRKSILEAFDEHNEQMVRKIYLDKLEYSFITGFEYYLKGSVAN
jgi:hypothetical protein